MMSIPPVDAPYLKAPPAPIPISNPPKLEAAKTCSTPDKPNSKLGIKDRKSV
jgi:hypothetical protein